MFLSNPPIPDIESFSQSTISSLDSGSFGRNRADGNIQQPTTSEVSDTETVMAYNENLDPPPPHDISTPVSYTVYLPLHPLLTASQTFNPKSMLASMSKISCFTHHIHPRRPY